ncbi:MAG: N-acetylmuramoyl-L-alanine amidase [Rhodospirillaceae bacterium]|nr:N-acetylmuramoyl-L-alanine amidase [Rhodospirillaceae bacterium]
MLIPRRFVVAAGAAAVLWPGASRALGIASAMRLHDHDTHTRLVLELSQQIDFGLFRLADPYRVVIDLPELDWAVGNNAPGAVGLVRAVRFGLFQAGNARIVVDLAGPVNIKNAFVLPATGDTPYRFVVDLEPMARDTFMALLGPQHRIGQFGGGGTRTAAAQPAPPKAEPKAAEEKKIRKKMIAIDPGHGGVDPGAIGVSGIYEKIITMAAAKQLKERLERTGRYDVVLTRDRDVSLGLGERRDIARAAQADIFLSLHADSMTNKSMRGLSVYTLSEKASDKEAEKLAEQENNADSIIGIDLTRESQEVRHILLDLAQRESMNLATKLADTLITSLKREVTLVPNSHRFARFAVLKSPDVPSVLIEMGYLSNREDETALKKDAYRAKLVSAIVRGLDSHFGASQSASRL